MRIGLVARDDSTRPDPIGAFVGAARSAVEDGFATFWVTQALGLDALTILALVAREVPDIELGTAVVPVYGRHPVVLATQALTTQVAAEGRLTLGIGLSHQRIVETRFGASFDRPVRYLREYLAILAPLLAGEAVDVNGEVLSATGQVPVVGAPTPVLVAALGPQMLALAGRMADGTITWLTGVQTVVTHTVPTIRDAAANAGRPTPRVAVGLPVCVTADAASARERVARAFRGYGALPSYRAMLDREGAAEPADVAIIGSASVVGDTLARLAAGGATDFVASIVGDAAERAATRELLAAIQW